MTDFKYCHFMKGAICRVPVLDRWLGRRPRPHGRFAVSVHEFVCSGMKQASACLFGGLMVALILAT